MNSEKVIEFLEPERRELLNRAGDVGQEMSDDDCLLSQAYDVFLEQTSESTVLNEQVCPKKEKSFEKQKPSSSSRKQKIGFRENDIQKPSTSRQVQVKFLEYNTQTDNTPKSLKSKEIEIPDESMEDDLGALFGSDYSDNDPTYQPENPKALSSDSDDSGLITLEELLDPDFVNKANKKRVQKRKVIDMVFGNKSESRQIAELILDEIFQKSWKILKPLARWRKSDPMSWKVNVAKKRRAEGLSYITKKKIRNPKVPKLTDCSKCKYKCTENITENQQQIICRKYWSLNFVEKKTFILRHVNIIPTKRVLKQGVRSTERSFTKKCFFEIAEQQKYVCSRFFCNTLSISPAVVADAIKKKDEYGCYSETDDPRGRKEPPNKTPIDKVEEVKSHISSFPTMESHYVRKQTKRKYLYAGLTLCKMYSLYVEQCEKNKTTPVSEMTYRRIFSTEFNLGFFMPKKDQCLVCTKYNRANSEEKVKLDVQYREHINRKITCNSEKAKDKERAEKEPNFLSATFDLQAILQIPSTEVGLLYYTRKLTIFNFTLYESALPNEAYCFVWSEIHGKKGSAEIGTVLLHYLTKCVPEQVTEISLFSDTCGGQNRNQFIASLLLWVINQSEHLNIIEHKFLESGHSYMEADSMHSAIETAKKHNDVYCISDWIKIFKKARSKETYKKGTKKVKKNQYNVKEFKYSEFKDLKQLANTIILNRTTNTEGQKVQWLKIKRMKYIKGDRIIYYNYDMSTNFMKMDVTCSSVQSNTSAATTAESDHGYATRRRSKQAELLVNERPTTLTSNEFSFPPLQQLYNSQLTISLAKKKDLLNLCEKGVIPEEYHGWFQSMATDNEVVSRHSTSPDSEESESDDVE